MNTSMKTYKIFVNHQGSSEAVKQGWSWPGFFFNFIWALIKRMWVLGVTLMILSFVLGFFEGTTEVSSGKEAASRISAFTSVLNLVIAVIFGVNGNKWREKNLLSRGYKYQYTVDARNPEAAIASWFTEGKSD
jgi:Protein of unknown function (DUF2628)